MASCQGQPWLALSEQLEGARLRQENDDAVLEK